MWQHYVGSILHDRGAIECTLSPQGKTLEIVCEEKAKETPRYLPQNHVSSSIEYYVKYLKNATVMCGQCSFTLSFCRSFFLSRFVFLLRVEKEIKICGLQEGNFSKWKRGFNRIIATLEKASLDVKDGFFFLFFFC
jgi:hypothetical protein